MTEMLEPGSQTFPASLPEILISNWQTMVATMLAGLIAATVYLNFVERQYATTLTLVPTEENARVSGTLGGGLGNLASLAGVELPQSSGSMQFEMLPDAIISQETASKISEDPAILHTVFAQNWDPATKMWKAPGGAVSTVKRTIKDLTALIFGGEVRDRTIPDTKDMLEYLEKRVSVTRDKKRPVVLISFTHGNREFAETFVLKLWKITDDRLKDAALARSTSNINYLDRRVLETQTIEYKMYLLNVMSSEEKRRMITSGDLPYAAEPFGMPVSTSEPVQPDIVFTVVAGTAIGLMFGILLVLWRRRAQILPIFTNMLRDE